MHVLVVLARRETANDRAADFNDIRDESGKRTPSAFVSRGYGGTLWHQHSLLDVADGSSQAWRNGHREKDEGDERSTHDVWQK